MPRSRCLRATNIPHTCNTYKNRIINIHIILRTVKCLSLQAITFFFFSLHSHISLAHLISFHLLFTHGNSLILSLSCCYSLPNLLVCLPLSESLSLPTVPPSTLPLLLALVSLSLSCLPPPSLSLITPSLSVTSLSLSVSFPACHPPVSPFQSLPPCLSPPCLSPSLPPCLSPLRRHPPGKLSLMPSQWESRSHTNLYFYHLHLRTTASIWSPPPPHSHLENKQPNVEKVSVVP